MSVEINQRLPWAPAPSGSRSGEAPGGSGGASRPGSTDDISALAQSPDVQWSPRGLQVQGGEGPGRQPPAGWEERLREGES